MEWDLEPVAPADGQYGCPLSGNHFDPLDRHRGEDFCLLSKSITHRLLSRLRIGMPAYQAARKPAAISRGHHRARGCGDSTDSVAAHSLGYHVGSALVRAIRDELNAREEIAAAPGAGPEPWTLRQVEMVLFMDGY